jgi:tRNA A58 N-methylase Trm61
MDEIDIETILAALDVNMNREQIFKAGTGSGASGSYFLFSHNRKFIIKTMRGDEKTAMIKMVDSYITHIRNSNNKSLLARIYGIFTIKTPLINSIDLIIL